MRSDAPAVLTPQPNDNSSPLFNTHLQNTIPDITLYTRAVWRAKWGIAALVILVAVLAYLVVSTIKPTYKASATLLIDNKAPQVLSIEQIYGLEGAGNNYLQTQFGLLKSRPIIERAVKQLKLTEHPEFDPRQDKPNPWSLASLQVTISNHIPGLVDAQSLENAVELTDEQLFDKVVRRVLSRIQTEMVKGSNLVLIHAESEDAKLAASLANAVAKAYIENQLDASAEMTGMATDWMNTRLTDLKATVQESENRLKEYLESQNLIDLGGITSISASELDGLNQRLIDARRASLEVESEYQQIQRIRNQGWEVLATTPAVMRNGTVATFRTEEAKARAKVEELSQRYGAGHPSMISAQSELDAVRTSLRMQVEQVVASIERNYQVAKASEGAVRQAYEAKKGNIKDISRAEFKLKELQREVESNKALYDTFMKRLKETTATSDMQSVNARIADPAVSPESPVRPIKSLVVAVAALLAAIVAIGLTVVLTLLNNTFKRIEDVENALNLPVFGLLPKVGRVRERKELVERFKLNKDRPFSEAVKTIRTSVSLSSIDETHPILMVTSSLPGEGKTTTSTNIAFAFAQLEKTVLIEADMRRPTLAKTLGVPVGTPGLANWLAGGASLEEVVLDIDGLSVITAGLVPPNPLELISSSRFEQLLKTLSETYDRILIDSPPINAVSDGLVLSRYADAVVFVVKADATPQTQVKTALGKLLQHGAHVKGVVLNQVDVKKALKEGGAYAGYYDYYGYSQGHKA